ncbi:MAG: DJ-1/PfpI family protein [Candidatus Hadarchaeales archaeon]
MARAVILLADGFEEIETSTTFDILVRCGAEVKLAGLKRGIIRGSRGMRVQPDTTVEKVKVDELDALILPGGYPGYENLRKSEHVKRLVREAIEKGKLVGAICAAPVVLADAGVLQGKKCTVYPGFEEELKKAGAKVSDSLVVRDGNLITSRGPGTAFAFALALAGALTGKETVEKVKKETLADRGARF